MYGDAEFLVNAAKANMTVDLDMEFGGHRLSKLDSDDESLTTIAKKRKRSKASNKKQSKKKSRKLRKIPENFDDADGEDHGLTISRYVLGEAKTHGWDKLENASNRLKWVATMLPVWKESFLLA